MKMRMIAFATMLGGGTLIAGAQTVTAPNPPLNVLADSTQKNGSVMQLDGHVRIAACSIVTTDHATWHDNEFELGESAHMQLTDGVKPLR
jgi:hypothetical protein